MKYAYFYVIIISLFCSCTNRRTSTVKTSTVKTSVDSVEFYTFDLENVVENETPSSVSNFIINDIAQDIRFIPLESSPQAWHSNIGIRLFKNKDSYIVSDIHPRCKITKYDSNGSFVKNIARVGRGPSEIIECWGVFSNTKLNQLCVQDRRKIVVNSFDGKHLYDIRFEKSTPMVSDVVLLNTGDYVCTPFTFLATKETDIPYLFFMNDIGEVVYSLRYDKKRDIGQKPITESNQNRRLVYERSIMSSNFLGEALFRDLFSDVVYKIKGKDSVLPHINLHRGELMPTPEDTYSLRKNANKIYCQNMTETAKYFIVTYVYDGYKYTAIWDKKSEKIVANIGVDRESREKTSQYKMFTRYRTPLSTEILVNIVLATEDKLYCLLEAETAMDFLPNVKADDNYIIMIIDLR